MTLIVDESLILPGLPEVPGSLPLFRVTQSRAVSRGDATVRRELEARVERWTGAFPVHGERADLGDRILFLSDDAALEVFVPSESVWWSDRATAFAERSPEQPLPAADEATELAKRLVEELDVADAALRVRDVSPIHAATVSSPTDYVEREPVPTGMTVSFGYVLEALPVVGPGVRIRVTYSGGGKLAEFARFWRTPVQAGKVKPIHPMGAVERLANDQRFADVGAGGVEVALDSSSWRGTPPAPASSSGSWSPCTRHADGSTAVNSRTTSSTSTSLPSTAGMWR